MNCMRPLSRFFYVSVRTDPGDMAAVRHILQISRRNNRRLDVTGCLLVAGPLFAQVLEGRRDDVVPLVERIRRDPRHGAVRVLVERPASIRQYGEWSMGYFDDSGHEERLRALLDGGVADANADADDIAGIMGRMRPDTVLGALR